jgi:serine/threonine-protein kinase
LRPGDSLAILMENMEGGSLATAIAKKSLDRTAMNITIISMVRGLFKLHSMGIIHRDLKPSNILFTGEGIAKIGDFGSARGAEAEVSQTAGGKTLLYAAPELHDGETATKASDVWSLGVTLYELLTGESVFRMPLRKLMRQIDLDERPAVPSIACPELVEVIKSCWEKDPTKRMTILQIVDKLSGAGWNAVEGADPKATKAFLKPHPRLALLGRAPSCNSGLEYAIVFPPNV